MSPPNGGAMDPSPFCDAWLNISKHRDRSRTSIGGREFPASLPPCGWIPPLDRLKEPEIISSGLSTQWMNCGNLVQPLCKPCAAASLFGGVIWLRASFGQWGAITHQELTPSWHTPDTVFEFECRGRSCGLLSASRSATPKHPRKPPVGYLSISQGTPR
jgi:hypothetical protein